VEQSYLLFSKAGIPEVSLCYVSYRPLSFGCYSEFRINQEELTMRITLLRTTFIYSLISVFMLGSVQASAALVDNQHLAQSAQVEQQRDAVRDLLARDDLRAALLDYGVSEEAVDARVDQLSAAELQQLHAQLAELPAGANAGVGFVLGVILIFILLDLRGATDVFPRI